MTPDIGTRTVELRQAEWIRVAAFLKTVDKYHDRPDAKLLSDKIMNQLGLRFTK